ncbi:MAG: hypothetical protein J5687_09160 [Treponema sp.]|nr:hypothetical protein [Treponema sp.]
MTNAKNNAKYIFEQKEDAPTRYILKSKEGADVPNFPAEYKRGADKGKKYIGFRRNETYSDKFTHIFELAAGSVFTGVNFPTQEENKNKVFGNTKNPKGLNRNDAVLIEFKNEGKIIEINFFFGQAVNAETLYNRWIAGNLNMTVELVPAGNENAVNLF